MLINSVRPPNLYQGPGAALPIGIRVVNLGTAASVTASVTLPSGASIIDPDSGQAGGQTATFTFSLAINEEKTVRFWVRLPDVSGPMTLQAMVSGSHNGHAVAVAPSPTLTLRVQQPPTLSSIRKQLDALVQKGHPDSAVLRSAISFLDLAIEASPEQATIHVLAAVDALSGLKDPSVTDSRVNLGTWLRWAGLSAD